MPEQKQQPVVSVVMPAYNAAGFIREAVGSVLRQTMEDWELLIVDDCSKDDSLRIAEEYAKHDSRIRVLHNEHNYGVARTRNRAIVCSCGQYIAFLDSDDVWQPDKLKKQLALLEAEDGDMSYCAYKIIGADGAPVRPDYHVPQTVTYGQLLKENVICCSSMLIKKSVLEDIRFNTDFFHEDYVLGLDILKAGHKAVGCRELLVHWRYIENSRSFNKKKSAKNRWRIYREYLKLPFFKSVYYFGHYAVAGLQKYRKR